MTNSNVKFIEIPSISNTAEILWVLLQKTEEAECDSLPEIYKKLIKLNEILENRNFLDDEITKINAFNLTVDIEEQIFEQLAYAEETQRALKDFIENLDALARVLHAKI